jgi:hypothetical protein
MAEKKNTPAATPTTPSNGGAAKPQPRLTKMEAVRRALAKLGGDAEPRLIQQYVQERFGVEMTTDQSRPTRRTSPARRPRASPSRA